MIAYHIIAHAKLGHLNRIVNDYCNGKGSVGWQPFGGICWDGQQYIQPMINYDARKVELK